MDHVCLEPTSLEAVETIIRNRPIKGVVHQFCLQVLDGLDGLLEQQGVKLLGTPYQSLAEMRHIPSLWTTLSEIGIPLRPHRLSPNPGRTVKDAASLGYPILTLITDATLNPEADIIYSEAMLKAFLEQNKPHITVQTPLFMEAYDDGMTFFEVMAVCDGRDARTVAVLENIEEYGIHSGDCASAIPTLSVGSLHKAYADDAVRRIVGRFHVVGHLHMELAIKGRHVYVTAVRPFPSRNLPFVEKALGLPIHEWAARLILGEKIADLDIDPRPEPEGFFVKELVFPFSRFPKLDPILSPRMRSFGQVFGTDDTFGKAYYKSQMAINPNIPSQGKIFLSARDEDKEAILQVSKRYLELGFSLVSTEGTAQFLAERGIEVDHVHKVSDAQPNIIDLIKNGEIALVINIPGGFQSKQDEQMIRRVTIDHKIHLFTTTSGAFLLALGIESMRKNPLTIQPCHG
jgi:carbamoyl-phosphate synthase large subunit